MVFAPASANTAGRQAIVVSDGHPRQWGDHPGKADFLAQQPLVIRGDRVEDSLSSV
jgi:hypothetical protein